MNKDPFADSIHLLIPRPSRDGRELKDDNIKLSKNEELEVNVKAHYDFSIISVSINIEECLLRLIGLKDAAETGEQKFVSLLAFMSLLHYIQWPNYELREIYSYQHKGASRVQDCILTRPGCVAEFKSQRELSEEVGISLATVERCIRILKRAGIIIYSTSGYIAFDPFVIWIGNYEIRKSLVDHLLCNGAIRNPVMPAWIKQSTRNNTCGRAVA